MTDLLADAIWDGDPDTRWGAETEAAAIVDRLDALAAHVCHDGCGHPSHKLPLTDRARARTTDPTTSEAAADSQGNLYPKHCAVLEVAATIGVPFTRDVLVRRYSASPSQPKQTPQGIRSRARALLDAGYLRVVGEGESDTGRRAELLEVVR